ncbi:MAG: 4Fe-4S dicluster domain-containing protein [Akkermansiaceae bacterium]|nr:4Fe-4S dicluster domain-containing protein [Akkermansiaceae bacterium]MCP5551053.1 4Fe-4S dicluster domain-containing protein [Akkermansiaceae bacterium]
MTTEAPVLLSREHFDALLAALAKRGYTVVGPTVRDGTIVYDEIGRPEELPVGWTDEQEGGHYRLKRREDEALFGYVVGPQSWKKYLHPPRLRLVKAERDGDGALVFTDGDEAEPPRYAFLGMRSCELHAMTIQDRVFLGGAAADSHYERRRKRVFSIGVSCGEAGGTCFCASMNTGPAVTDRTPHDLALTEVIDSGRHFFVVAAGSDEGREVLAELPVTPAGDGDVAAAKERVDRAAASMGRSLNAEGVRELLRENLEHPRWDDVAQRCLTCANCTMVCPTCFCTTVEDVTDLTGDHAERWRRWDSCFTMDFTWMHGGGARQSAKSRYRQWLTHKLSTWHDQFDSSGCVGCGRCVSWCPVGIDLTEEIAAIRDSEPPAQPDES